VARRKDNSMEMMSGLPWQAGIVLGIVSYTCVRYVLAWFVATLGGSVGQTMGKQLSQGPSIAVAWLLLSACWLAALVSFIDTRRRRRLRETQTELNGLRMLDWREFHMLVRETFRRQGYIVQDVASGENDDGVDLFLRKDGTLTLVQCRQWWTKLVDVRMVREMYGLMNHHYADAVKIVAIGNYSDDARQFAQGKPIELIYGNSLLDMVRDSQKAAPKPKMMRSTDAVVRLEPICPSCGHSMVQRLNKRSGKHFWSCSNHPCQGTRVA
jgi:restriction system protein